MNKNSEIPEKLGEVQVEVRRKEEKERKEKKKEKYLLE